MSGMSNQPVTFVQAARRLMQHATLGLSPDLAFDAHPSAPAAAPGHYSHHMGDLCHCLVFHGFIKGR